MGDLEGLIGFLDDEEEEEKAAPSKQSKFDASVYSSSRSALPALKLSPYFQVNWKDRNPSQEVFGFRLAVESSSPFVDLFRAVPTISLHLLLHKKPVCPNKFVVVVVVKSRSPTRENAASNLPYQEWILTDLQGTEGRLLVFGEAFKQYEHGFGACKHPVLVLKTPSVLGSCLTVHYSNQLEICGESRDFAQCKSCPMATNSFISKYCPTHAEEEMRVCAANRSNVSIMSRQRKPPSTTVAAPHTITATSEYHTGIVLKPQVKDNRTLVREIVRKSNPTAGERMLMRALKVTGTPPVTSSLTTPELNSRVRHQVAYPAASAAKRTKLGSGLAGGKSSDGKRGD